MPGISQERFQNLGLGMFCVFPEAFTATNGITILSSGIVFYHACKRRDRAKGRLTYRGQKPTEELRCRHCHSQLTLGQWLVACAVWAGFEDHDDRAAL